MGGRAISLTHLALFLWVVYLALSPLYIFPSGQPQPVDWLGVIWVALVIVGLGVRFTRPVARIVGVLVLAVAWSAVVAVGWYLLSFEAEVLRAPLFYAYNVAIVIALLSIAARDRVAVLRATEGGLFLALTVIMVGLIVTDSDSYRNTSFFNNPNQLGYFGLLAGAMVGLIADQLGWSLVRMGLFGIAMVAALFSFSLAALGGVVVTVAWALRGVWSRWRRMSWVVMIFVLVATSAALWGEALYGTSLLEGWERRAVVADSKLEAALSERGYYRLFEYPQFLLTGAAEGALHRIGPTMRHEMHSTPGTIVFSYGVPGAVLSGIIILLLWRLGSAQLLAVFVGPIVYGLSHQGLRFTPLWLVAALYLVVVTSRESPSGRDHRLL